MSHAVKGPLRITIKLVKFRQLPQVIGNQYETFLGQVLKISITFFSGTFRNGECIDIFIDTKLGGRLAMDKSSSTLCVPIIFSFSV